MSMILPDGVTVRQSLYSYGLYSYGLFSYGLYRYGERTSASLLITCDARSSCGARGDTEREPGARIYF